MYGYELINEEIQLNSDECCILLCLLVCYTIFSKPKLKFSHRERMVYYVNNEKRRLYRANYIQGYNTLI